MKVAWMSLAKPAIRTDRHGARVFECRVPGPLRLRVPEAISRSKIETELNPAT